MISLLLHLALATDPGVFAVHCDAEKPNSWSCRAACWYGKDKDGGAYSGGVIFTKDQPSAQAAWEDLLRQQRNGCKP